MISVKEAKEIILSIVKNLPAQPFSLSDAVGLVLAADVFAITDIPAFQQSSMDGYAIAFEDINEELLINGEMAAGTNYEYAIKKNEASRIFTGAPLPKNTDTVVPQEFVETKDGKALIINKNLHHGIYVRAKGSEIKAGELALKKGITLNERAVGFLAGIGINKVSVYPSPKVAIIVTGNELQHPGNELLFGQVYETNSFSLTAALHQYNIFEVEIFYAADELNLVCARLRNALNDFDVILLTGGVSAGDYDFVVKAAETCDVKQHLHKIKQRPGKPLYVGSLRDKIIFGLPGNPASVLTCFYEYVLPALEKMMQKKNSMQVISAVLKDDFEKKKGLTHFMKGICENGNVSILSSQASYQLRSFAEANCLVVIEEEVEKISKGQKVEVHLLTQ